jgi:hypothetical protein
MMLVKNHENQAMASSFWSFPHVRRICMFFFFVTGMDLKSTGKAAIGLAESGRSIKSMKPKQWRVSHELMGLKANGQRRHRLDAMLMESTKTMKH